MVERDERELVRTLAQLLGRRAAAQIGDDVATLDLESGRYAVTVDSQIAGVHFPGDLDAATLARRLLAVNLSDLAAAGIDPALEIFGLCTLAAPRDFDHRRFFAALGTAAETSGLVIVGGDLAACPTLTTTLTLIGHYGAGTRPLLRSRAREGDGLWLGGTIGESALGRHLLAAGARWTPGGAHLDGLPAGSWPGAESAIRRHLCPRPQMALGHWLAQRPRAAALDLSDGLALDLHRLLDASGVAAQLVAEELPIPTSVFDLAPQLDLEPLDLALSGGEDYVLLFALPEGEEPPADFQAHSIGRVVPGRGATLAQGGNWRQLPAVGWDHLVDSGP